MSSVILKSLISAVCGFFKAYELTKSKHKSRRISSRNPGQQRRICPTAEIIARQRQNFNRKQRILPNFRFFIYNFLQTIAFLSPFFKAYEVTKSKHKSRRISSWVMRESSSVSILMSGVIPPPSYTFRPASVVYSVIRESGTFPTLPSGFRWE